MSGSRKVCTSCRQAKAKWCALCYTASGARLTSVMFVRHIPTTVRGASSHRRSVELTLITSDLKRGSVQVVIYHSDCQRSKAERGHCVCFHHFARHISTAEPLAHREGARTRSAGRQCPHRHIYHRSYHAILSQNPRPLRHVRS